jgi:hypothetical protein
MPGLAIPSFYQIAGYDLVARTFQDAADVAFPASRFPNRALECFNRKKGQGRRWRGGIKVIFFSVGGRDNAVNVCEGTALYVFPALLCPAGFRAAVFPAHQRKTPQLCGLEQTSRLPRDIVFAG